MSEASALPKLGTTEHSSAHGALSRYQDKLAQKYLGVIASVRNAAKQSSERTNLSMKQKLMDFAHQRDTIQQQQRDILESMGKELVTFEELKIGLEDLGEQIVNLAIELRREVVEIYDSEFQSLQPTINEAFKSCESYVTQLPSTVTRTLEDEVEHLNREYVTTKQNLIKMLYQHEIAARSAAQDTVDELIQRNDDWRINRFETLVNNSREKLDPQNGLDYGTIFEDFYKDQAKFTHCFHKVIQNVTLVVPPDQFGQSNLDDWWKEVEDIVSLHARFVQQFKERIQSVIENRTAEDDKLLSELEKELIELKDEEEAAAAIAELTPLQKVSRKGADNYLEKISKYWDNRLDAIRKSFESIRDFIQPLVTMYSKCMDDSREHNEQVEKTKAELRESSEEVIKQCESDIDGKTNEIQLLVDETEINARVNDCRKILNKLENEYRKFYEKSIKLFDEQPALVFKHFEPVEKELLDKLKMRKTSGAPEWMSSSRTGVKSSSAKKKARPVSRAAKKRGKKGAVVEEVEIFAFDCEDGSRFEETDQLEIIPQIEEFVDEAAIPQTHVKGKVKGKPTPTKAKPKPKAGKGKKGKNDEAEELEVPDFVLMETVPQVDGEPSIIVYTPLNDEIEEWKNALRKQIIVSFQEMFKKEITTAAYEQERQTLADELNERLRTHAPRINTIEINLARGRVQQVESRKVQLEKHFRKATQIFNKGLKHLESSITKLNERSVTEVGKLETYVSDLEKHKTEAALVLFNQDFGIENKKCLKTFEKDVEQQQKEITDFVNGFKASNDRFMRSVVDSSSVSPEEREMCMQFFERMDGQVAEISQVLNERIETIKTEFMKSRKKFTDEFELLFPRHKNDIQFIDAMNIALQESKTRLDSLFLKSRQQEHLVEESINALVEANKERVDPESMIRKSFELLDAMRLAVLKRAKYLNVLKSKITTIEAIQFICELDKESPDGDKSDGNSSARKGSARRASKARPDSTPKNVRPTKKALAEQASVEIMGTLQGQVDNIGNEMVTRLTPTMNDYYSQLKQAKWTITRTDQIPANAVECTEKLRTWWRETITGVPSYLKEAADKLRSQVSRAMEAANNTTETVYDLYTEFYSTMILTQRDSMQKQFQDTLQELVEERKHHRDALTPKMADDNNIDLLRKLLEDENTRREREMTTVNEYNDNVYTTEGRIMKLFIDHLPVITKTFLQMFDAFVLPEDMGHGWIEGARRLTLREMLKERERKAANPIVDQCRPFPQKQWPTIQSIMPVMLDVPLSIAQSNVSQATLAVGGRKTTARRKKTAERVSAPSTPTKSAPTKIPLTSEEIPAQNSFETAIHRHVVVKRNQSYNEYEDALNKRIDEFKVYIQSLREDSDVFSEYWKKCTSALKKKLPVSSELL